MVVQSKFVPGQLHLSIFDSVPFTCYELGHTWEPVCYMSFLQTVRDSFKYSLKLYASFYTATYLLKMRKKKNRKFGQLKNMLQDLIRSSIFLAANGALFMGGYCLVRHAMGKFYGWHPTLVGLIVGLISISLEKKSRRGMLTLYMANLATETLFKILVSRGLVRPRVNSEVVIFSIASAGFMSLFRKPNGLGEDLQSFLSYFVGTNEERRNLEVAASESFVNVISKFLTRAFDVVLGRLKHCHRSHWACPHQHSCLHYFLEGSLQSFLLGHVIHVGINFLQLIRRRRKFQTIFSDFSLASFLASYNFLFRTINCILRWLRDDDSPTVHGAVSGAVAGVSSMFYKSSAISLYFLFKLFEVYAMKARDRGWLPSMPNADKWIYSISLSLVLHAACLEPHHIRPAYWKFLCEVSGNKFPLMFRKLYDLYGTQASKLSPNFVPDFNPDFVTNEYVISVLKKHGKWTGK